MKTEQAEGFDLFIEGVENVHFERLASNAVIVNVHLKNGKIRAFTVGSNDDLLIKETRL